MCLRKKEVVSKRKENIKRTVRMNKLVNVDK